MAKIDQIPKDRLFEKFQSLPENVRDLLISVETSDTISEIAQAHGIAEEKIPEFSKLIGDVLYGLTPKENFAASIKEGLEISDEVAAKIAGMTNQKIFSKLSPMPAKKFDADVYREQIGEETAPSANKDEEPPTTHPQFPYKPNAPINDIRKRGQFRP